AVRALVDDGEFVEVYVQAPLEVCEQRDVKGLYKKAREGVIKGFTGIDDPYEAPLKPEIIIETDKMTLGQGADRIIDYLNSKSVLNSK
ncbi:MAG: adenylyl-sulfate kinase, partial [Candidatus Dadabacteria bacterium]|nr:adenylyl-sulfate kinase [Candidatus Dadabacteria bacterium]